MKDVVEKWGAPIGTCICRIKNQHVKQEPMGSQVRYGSGMPRPQRVTLGNTIENLKEIDAGAVDGTMVTRSNGILINVLRETYYNR